MTRTLLRGVFGSFCLCAIVGTAVAGEADPVHGAAPAGPTTELEVRAWLGVRSQFASMFTWLPTGISAAAAVDFAQPIRVELQLVGNPYTEGFQGMLSSGALIRLYDGRGRGDSILELQLPLQLAFGYLRAKWEAADGYDDHVSWVLLGPMAGLDFTWWVRESLGVSFAAEGSFLFRIADPGSEYGGGETAYGVAGDKIGVGEIILSVGMAFGVVASPSETR